VTHPYRYELVICVKIVGDGLDASGDGAKATADRLATLMEADPLVTYAEHWPSIQYVGKTEGEK
jgi:hypothetical protein